MRWRPVGSLPPQSLGLGFSAAASGTHVRCSAPHALPRPPCPKYSPRTPSFAQRFITRASEQVAASAGAPSRAIASCTWTGSQEATEASWRAVSAAAAAWRWRRSCERRCGVPRFPLPVAAFASASCPLQRPEMRHCRKGIRVRRRQAVRGAPDLARIHGARQCPFFVRPPCIFEVVPASSLPCCSLVYVHRTPLQSARRKTKIKGGRSVPAAFGRLISQLHTRT